MIDKHVNQHPQAVELLFFYTRRMILTHECGLPLSILLFFTVVIYDEALRHGIWDELLFFDSWPTSDHSFTFFPFFPVVFPSLTLTTCASLRRYCFLPSFLPHPIIISLQLSRLADSCDNQYSSSFVALSLSHRIECVEHDLMSYYLFRLIFTTTQSIHDIIPLPLFFH